MNVAPGAPGCVRAYARVEHRLHKTPAVVEDDARAEILLPPGTAEITSSRVTREHPDKDNGRSREDRDQAGPLYPNRFLRRRLRWEGVGATRIVVHLLASKSKSGSATLHHLFRETNCEFAGQCAENRCLPERQQRGHGTVSWRKPRWRRRAMNWKLSPLNWPALPREEMPSYMSLGTRLVDIQYPTYNHITPSFICCLSSLQISLTVLEYLKPL